MPSCTQRRSTGCGAAEARSKDRRLHRYAMATPCGRRGHPQPRSGKDMAKQQSGALLTLVIWWTGGRACRPSLARAWISNRRPLVSRGCASPSPCRRGTIRSGGCSRRRGGCVRWNGRRIWGSTAIRRASIAPSPIRAHSGVHLRAVSSDAARFGGAGAGDCGLAARRMMHAAPSISPATVQNRLKRQSGTDKSLRTSS